MYGSERRVCGCDQPETVTQVTRPSVDSAMATEEDMPLQSHVLQALFREFRPSF